MNRHDWRAGLALAVISVLTAGAALGEGQGAVLSQAPAQPMEQRALDLVKGMSDKLAAAKAFGFRTRDTIEATGGNGQFLNFFAEAEIEAIRPDKLRVTMTGDAPPFDLYYDGAKMTVYVPEGKLYASEDAPKTIDELLPFAVKKAGIVLPFADVLYSNPYAVLTRGITSAYYAGHTMINGAKCEHLAFSAPGIEYQLWIDAKTSLPCLLMGTMLNVQGAPRFAVEFFDWALDRPPAHLEYTLAKPDDADQMDFRALTGQ